MREKDIAARRYHRAGTDHAVLPGGGTTCGQATLPPGNSSGKRALQGRDPLARARHCGRRSQARRGYGRLGAREVWRGPADRVAELQVTRLGVGEMRGGRLDSLCLKIGGWAGGVAPNEGVRPPPISCLGRTCARRPAGARALGQRRARRSRSCRARCGGALRGARMREAAAARGSRSATRSRHVRRRPAGRGAVQSANTSAFRPGSAAPAARRSPGTVRGRAAMAPPPSPC